MHPRAKDSTPRLSQAVLAGARHRDSKVRSAPCSPIWTVNLEPSAVTRTRMNSPSDDPLLAISDGSVLSASLVAALRWS